MPTCLRFYTGAHRMLGEVLSCPNKPTPGFLGTQLSSVILTKEWMLPSGLRPRLPNGWAWGKPPQFSIHHKSQEAVIV